MESAKAATIPPPIDAKRKLASGDRIKLDIAMGSVKRKSERPFES
jgi:hypothetical protein